MSTKIRTATVFAFDFAVTDHATTRNALIQSKIAKAINLATDDRAILAAVIRGETVDVDALHRAIVAALGVAVTRRGQSMARRRDREALLALYALLPAPAGVLPQVEVRKSVTVKPDHDTMDANRRLRRENADLRDGLREVERQNAARLALLNEKKAEIDHLRAALTVASVPPPVEADVAALRFALDMMTGEQRQRVSDFRTGFRAGRA